MKLAVYTDYAYRRDAGGLFAERAFVLFIGELARHVDELTLVGRLHPATGKGERSHYRVPDDVRFVPLPHYETLADPRAAARAAAGSRRGFASVLADVDAVWLLGPHPLAILFAAQAARARRRVILGVRQDLPTYARTRHPSRRGMHMAADSLEATWRLLARRFPTVVVGPDLARRYSGARRLLELSVSLVRQHELPDAPPERQWEGELTALSVGRLDREKNPLLLADVLHVLREGDDRWRLVVCGEGPLEEELRARLEALGLQSHARLTGYVPHDNGLAELYRESHALLHVSWTEGVPQVLFEAFAAGLPVVATAVGGVAEAAGNAALLVGPGDPAQPAAALERLAADPALRARLAEAGLERVRGHTIEAEAARVAAFITAGRA
jgi:glycosyltransferase involved in cell wall biosynthesis